MKNNNTSFADSILNATFAGVKDAANSDAVNTLLDKYGLNWVVAKEPLYRCTDFAALQGTTDVELHGVGFISAKSTGFYGIVRQDNGTTFATCKDGYEAFQNSELAEMLIRLSEKTGYDLYKGGMFNGGAKVYVQLTSPNKISNIGDNLDSVKGYLTGINSHDGSTSLGWGSTNITISCTNTFMAAYKGLRSKARHTANLSQKVEAAIRELNGIIVAEKSLFDSFIKLAEIPVTRPSIAAIVKEITGVDTTVPTAKMEDDNTTYAINRSREVLECIATETKQKGDTMWGLLSGVTNYTTHVLQVPKRDNARLESLYTGSGYKINNEAYQLISKIALQTN